MISTPHQILFGWWNHEEWDGRGTWHVRRRGEVQMELWWENIRESDHLEELGIDGRY